MLRHFWIAAVLVAGIGVTQTYAGVAGGEFSGTVTDPFTGESDDVISDFELSGNGFNENFNGDDYPGSYTENDFGFFSIWNATYNDDPAYAAAGLCVFSMYTLYVIYEIDGQGFDAFVGVLTKTGDAPQTSTPGSPGSGHGK